MFPSRSLASASAAAALFLGTAGCGGPIAVAHSTAAVAPSDPAPPIGDLLVIGEQRQPPGTRGDSYVPDDPVVGQIQRRTDLPPHTIVLKGMRLLPASAEVAPGERWLAENRDTVTHKLGIGPSSGDPVGFDRRQLGPGGQDLLQMPSAAGTYTVACRYHPDMTMTVVVR